MSSTRQLAVAVLILCMSIPLRAAPLGSVVLYQGRLENNGAAANGDFVMTFQLFDTPSGSSPYSVLLIFDGATGNPPRAHVENGVFTVPFDFGPLAFDGRALWLEISVAGVTLTPRQQLTEVPYAQYSQRAATLTMPFHANVNSPNADAFSVDNTTGTGLTAAISGNGYLYGGKFQATDTLGEGVFGLATHTTGQNSGVFGLSLSQNGYGVHGANGVGGYSGFFDGKVYINGNLGIGTPSPTARLHLSQTGVAPEIRVNGDAGMNDNEVWAPRTLYQNNATLLGRQYWRGKSGGGPDFVVDTRNVADALVIQDAGTVGLGISDPMYRLDAKGRIRVRGTTADGGGVWLTRPGAAAADLSYVGRGSDSELWTGFYSNTNGGWNLIVLDAGNVGIGTTMPTERLTVSGNIRASGSVFASCGTLTCSDERLKRNVEPLGDALHVIARLRAVSFDWRTDEFPDRRFSSDRQIGFLAQDIQKVIPSCVKQDSAGYSAVDYARLTPLLVRAVQEQQAQIDTLRAEVSELKSKDAELLARLERIEADIDKRSMTKDISRP